MPFIKVHPINLKFTMESGQPPQFTWEPVGDGYERLLDGRLCRIWQEGDKIYYTSGFGEYISDMLRIEDNLDDIYNKIITDPVMERAVSLFYGMRVTRNDPWESFVCFLCSQNSNIKRIRSNVKSLMADGKVLAPEKILCHDLKICKLGYREKFLDSSSRIILEKGIEYIRDMEYHEARVELQKFPGVGPKVADCILLFGYGRLEAFPLDVWTKRALENYYGITGQKKMEEFIRKKWGKYGGYTQQYLFNLIRYETGKYTL